MEFNPSSSPHDRKKTVGVSDLESEPRPLRVPSFGIPTFGGGDSNSTLFDYFREVCAKEVSLYFESSIWECLVLQLTHHEPFAYHAALAASALSRQHYTPAQKTIHTGRGTIYAGQYAMIQYGKAVAFLNSRLSGTTQSSELALWGCILFVNLEFLLARDYREPSISTTMMNHAQVHINGAISILHHLRQEGRLHILSNCQHLDEAVFKLQFQLFEFQNMDRDDLRWKL